MGHFLKFWCYYYCSYLDWTNEGSSKRTIVGEQSILKSYLISWWSFLMILIDLLSILPDLSRHVILWKISFINITTGVILSLLPQHHIIVMSTIKLINLCLYLKLLRTLNLILHLLSFILLSRQVLWHLKLLKHRLLIISRGYLCSFILLTIWYDIWLCTSWVFDGYRIIMLLLDDKLRFRSLCWDVFLERIE